MARLVDTHRPDHTMVVVFLATKREGGQAADADRLDFNAD